MPLLTLTDKLNIVPNQPITGEADAVEILRTLERKYPRYADRITEAKKEGYTEDEIEQNIIGTMLQRKQEAIEAGYSEEEIDRKINDMLTSPPPPDISQSVMRGISGSVGSTIKGAGKLIGNAGGMSEEFYPDKSLGTKLGEKIEQAGEAITPKPLTNLQEEERGRLGKYTEMGANVAADIGTLYMPLSAATKRIPAIEKIGQIAAKAVKKLPKSVSGPLPDIIRKYAPKIIEETPHLAAVFGGAAGIKSGGDIEEMASGAAIAPFFAAATMPASKILKVILGGSVGYGQSKLAEADTDETIFNTALMSVFAALTPAKKSILINELKENPNKLLKDMPAGKELLLALPAGKNAPITGEGFEMKEPNRIIRRPKTEPAPTEYYKKTPDGKIERFYPKGEEVKKPIEPEVKQPIASVKIEQPSPLGNIIGYTKDAKPIYDMESKAEQPVAAPANKQQISPNLKQELDRPLMADNAKINDITKGEAIERLAKGDESVIPHIQDGIEKLGNDVIADEVYNKALGMATKNRTLDDFKKIEVNVRAAIERPSQKQIDTDIVRQLAEMTPEQRARDIIGENRNKGVIQEKEAFGKKSTKPPAPEVLYHYTDTKIKGNILAKGSPHEQNYFGDGVYLTEKNQFPGKYEYRAGIPENLKILDLTSEKAYENFRTQISKEINMPLKRSGESLYDDLRRTAAFSENEKVINEKIRNAVEKISKEYDAIKSPYFGATPAENSFELIIKKDIPLGKIQVEAKPINHIQEALVRGQIEQKLINLGKQGFELEGSKEIFKDELVNKFGQPIDNVKRIIDEVSSQPNVKKAFEREPADVLTPTEKPVEALYTSFISTDMQGNKVEQQLAKIATKKETTGGIARREGYNSIPIKEGYEIVFKPYGEKGKGYYYSRKITAAPKILKRKELKPAAGKVEPAPETVPNQDIPFTVGDRVRFIDSNRSPQVRIVERFEEIDPQFPDEKFITLKNERTGEIERGIGVEQIVKVKKKATTLELGGLQWFFDKYFSAEKVKIKEDGDIEFDYKEHLKGKRPYKTGENVIKTIKEFTGIISTELKNIHPDIKTFARRNFLDTALNISRDEIKARPFIDKSLKLPEHIRGELSEALMNGDISTSNKIAGKYGLLKDIDDVRNIFAEIYMRAKKAGIDIGYIKNYWNRVVKDPEGLISSLSNTKDWSVIDRLIKEKEAKDNTTLTDTEKAVIADNFLRGYPQEGINFGTKSVKERKITRIPQELLKFYMPADEGLIPYIRSINKAIGIADFFGKNKKLDINPDLITNRDIDNSIGDYIIRLKNEGKVKAEDELKLRDLLQTYLQPTHASYGVRAYKNLTYLTTLSHLSPIITQIGDLPFVVEELGFIQTAKSLGKVLKNRVTRTKSEVTPKDIAIESVMEELKVGEDALARFLKKALTGFTAMDRIPKETLLNGKLSLMRKQAAVNSPKLIKELTELLGEENVEQAVKDLKTGKVTDDILFTLFNTLSDIQPITPLEVPQKYHRTNWGKTFYALKTYQLKLLDVFRNKIIDRIKNGDREEKIEGLKSFIRLSTSLVLLNAGLDEVKDFINGRKTDFSDRVVDNILKLGGFSRYTLWKTREEGIGKGLLTQFAPPLGVFDAALLDVAKPDDKGLRVTRYIPLAGEVYYWWLGRGKEISKQKELKKRKELLNKLQGRAWKNRSVNKNPFGRKREIQP